MTAYPVPSSQRTSNPTVMAPYDEQERLRKRVSVLEKPTNSPDGSGPVSQDQLATAINTRAPAGLSNIAVLDFPSIAAGATAILTIAVAGAVVGDTVALGPPASVNAGLIWQGQVTAPDVVSVRLTNTTGGAIDPPSATWKATIIP